MKRQALIVLLLFVLSALLSSCITIHLPAMPTETPSASPAGQTAEEQENPNQPTLATEPSNGANEGQQGESAEPTQQLVETTSTPVPDGIIQGQCAYITGMSMSMDGQTDITFDYVDWLSGNEAERKYIEDHPGATSEDIEGAGIYEIGYIRNVNDKLRTFRTRTDTAYFLPDTDDLSTITEVSYNEFRDRMFQAVETGENSYLTFVMIDLQGDTITRIEWLYLP